MVWDAVTYGRRTPLLHMQRPDGSRIRRWGAMVHCASVRSAARTFAVLARQRLTKRCAWSIGLCGRSPFTNASMTSSFPGSESDRTYLGYDLQILKCPVEQLRLKWLFRPICRPLYSYIPTGIPQEKWKYESVDFLICKESNSVMHWVGDNRR